MTNTIVHWEESTTTETSITQRLVCITQFSSETLLLTTYNRQVNILIMQPWIKPSKLRKEYGKCVKIVKPVRNDIDKFLRNGVSRLPVASNNKNYWQKRTENVRKN